MDGLPRKIIDRVQLRSLIPDTDLVDADETCYKEHTPNDLEPCADVHCYQSESTMYSVNELAQAKAEMY